MIKFAIIIFGMLFSHPYPIVQNDEKTLLIKDEKAAVDFAFVVWKSNYSRKLHHRNYYTANLQQDSLWSVHGRGKGGSYILFNGYNCEVYEIEWGK